MTATATKHLTYDEEVKRMNAVYEGISGKKMTLNALIVGPAKSGKTHLTTTGRGPIYYDMFDPGGDKILPIQQGFKSGDLMVQRWNGLMSDDSEKLTQYDAWVLDFEAKVASGFFKNVGTYVLDSLTFFVRSMIWSIAHHKGREDHIPAIHDYMVAANLVRQFITTATNLPCDFLMTAHMTMDKDEISGRIKTSLNVFKTLKVDVPAMFDDYYVTRTKNTPEGTKYYVLTRPQGDYDAGSRLGSSVLDKEEEPNLSAMIKKIEAIQ